jgi:hypothetical protein
MRRGVRVKAKVGHKGVRRGVVLIPLYTYKGVQYHLIVNIVVIGGTL